MRVQFLVRLRPQILDPQGKAVAHTLAQLGHDTCSNVRIGKLIELDIDEDNHDKALEKAHLIAKELLINDVMEDYDLTVINT